MKIFLRAGGLCQGDEITKASGISLDVPQEKITSAFLNSSNASMIAHDFDSSNS